MPCGIYQFQAKNVCNARVAAMAVTFFETFELRKIVHEYTFIVQKWDEEKKREGVSYSSHERNETKREEKIQLDISFIYENSLLLSSLYCMSNDRFYTIECLFFIFHFLHHIINIE